jgi:hypothetical protein
VKRLATGLIVFFLLWSGSALAREPACTPRPLPPALDAVGEPAARTDSIVFAATPSDYPGRAWVVRLSRRGKGNATLEIVRLRRQMNCNRYDIEKRWRSRIGSSDYAAVEAAVARWTGLPSDRADPSGARDDGDEIVLDGIPIEIRLQSNGRRVAHSLNHYGKSGGELSAIFRSLLVGHVPVADLPAEDWRTHGKP